MFSSQENMTTMDGRFARFSQGAKLLRSLWPQAGESQFTVGFSGGFSLAAFFLGGLGAVPKSLTKIVVLPKNPENGQVLKSAGIDQARKCMRNCGEFLLHCGIFEVVKRVENFGPSELAVGHLVDW